jgi:hypothetical protein
MKAQTKPVTKIARVQLLSVAVVVSAAILAGCGHGSDVECCEITGPTCGGFYTGTRNADGTCEYWGAPGFSSGGQVRRAADGCPYWDSTAGPGPIACFAQDDVGGDNSSADTTIDVPVIESDTNDTANTSDSEAGTDAVDGSGDLDASADATDAMDAPESGDVSDESDAPNDGSGGSSDDEGGEP